MTSCYKGLFRFTLCFSVLVATATVASALNQKLEAMRPGLYASGLEGGCTDPDGKDHLFIDRTELHEYETHCKIRRVTRAPYFYVLETDCEMEGEFGHVTYEVAPLAPGTLVIQKRKGVFIPADTQPTAYHLCPETGFGKGAR